VRRCRGQHFCEPAQFAPNEDFDKYPRTFEADCAMLEGIGVHALYLPSARDMYPESYSTYVEVGGVSQGLCGGSRPHFFRGVATVVTKLFNAVEPDRAYFGQKDAAGAVIRDGARPRHGHLYCADADHPRADGLPRVRGTANPGPEERPARCASPAALHAERRLNGGCATRRRSCRGAGGNGG
jgi:pantoate--beta-alanine ligase